MVELTVLGNYGPYPAAQGACSGYLLNVNGFYIMLDCGNGSFSKLQKYADYTKLGILFLSHLHPDHYCDIYCLRQALKYQMREGIRKDPLFVYLPEGPEEIAAQIRQWDDVFTVVSLEEAQAAVNDFNLFQLKFFPVQHQMPAYGVQFCIEGEALLTYTGDTGWFAQLDTYCQNSAYLLAEASLRNCEMASCGQNHMTAGQAGTLAQNSGAHHLILTHFFPETNLHQLQREAEQNFDGPVYMSATGKKYILQP
ncbi:MAG: MBL fold metallo-hydrolase [Peptococcaceae bacterium]